MCEFCTWPFFYNKELSLFSTFCNNLDEEARAGCFALVVFFLPFVIKIFVLSIFQLSFKKGFTVFINITLIDFIQNCVLIYMYLIYVVETTSRHEREI